jgi:hypothetical protein
MAATFADECRNFFKLLRAADGSSAPGFRA